MPPIASLSHFARSSLATGFFLTAVGAGTGTGTAMGREIGLGLGAGGEVADTTTGVEGPEVGVL